MSIGIYLIQNQINHKCYIGQSLHIERRWLEHKNSINSSKKTVFIQALKKYGWNNFQCSILEETTPELLDEREQYWINQYNTLIPNGYNTQLGGKSGEMVCPEEIVEIQNLLETTRIPMEQIADDYFMSLRSIIRINQGDVWLDDQKEYPLRKRLERIHGNGLEYCPICGKPKGRDAYYCIDCAHVMQRKTERPSREQLLQEIATSSFLAVSKKYGVSDKAVVKWCKNYGLPTHKKEIKELYETLK